VLGFWGEESLCQGSGARVVLWVGPLQVHVELVVKVAICWYFGGDLLGGGSGSGEAVAEAGNFGVISY